MKRIFPLIFTVLAALAGGTVVYAAAPQDPAGDKPQAEVKMRYVYSMEEALRQAHAQDKPIFFNCYASWAVPCQVMDQEVFSNEAFAQYMDKNFVCLFMEMTSREAQAVAKKYDIKAFAQYLVLDKEGEVLLKILGGKVLPEFQECVALALSPKTSLKGTQEAYQAGKRDKKTLLAYSRALRLAGLHDRFREVAAEYCALLSPKDYSRPENWDVFTSQITSRDTDFYRYLVAHKADFEKKIGAEKVNRFLDTCFFPDLYAFAVGRKEHDGVQLLDLYNQMLRVALPDSSLSYTIHRLAKQRGEGQYEALYQTIEEEGKRLRQLRYELVMSFQFPQLSDDQKMALSAFWQREAALMPDHLKRPLLEQAQRLLKAPEEGIAFQVVPFEEALAKAEAEGKLIFMDCYTSWCGPCKQMDAKIFPLKEVGEAFNPSFVSLKKDMEKGEGMGLAQRYNVQAFPTMLILDATGKELHRIVGGRSAARLLEEVAPYLKK